MSGENLTNDEREVALQDVAVEAGVTGSDDSSSDPVETAVVEAEPAASTHTVASDATSDGSVQQGPAADVVKSASEVIERAKAALSETRSLSAGSAATANGRDVPVSSVVHLMGLATSKQLNVIEAKIDTMTTRVTSLSTKLDRVSSQLDALQSGFSTDRIDFQLSDIKGILKKVLPHVIAGSTEVSAPSAASQAVVVSSPKDSFDDAKRKAEEAEEYQRREAKRVREEAEHGTVAAQVAPEAVASENSKEEATAEKE